MENKEWNKLQIDLYDALKAKSKEVPIGDVIDSYQGNHKVWQEFIDLLKSKVDDFGDNVRDIQVHYHYLIIKCDIFDYVIIDMIDNKTLSYDDIKSTFGENFFIMHFKEQPIGLDKYTFLESSDPLDIVNFYITNRDVLMDKRTINYQLTNSNGRCGVTYSVIKNELTLYFHGFGEFLRVNYLFFDGDLNPIGVSNPTGNMDELKIIADDLPNLMVPKYLLKDRVKRLRLD